MPLTASAAEWQIEPSFDISGEYADNPRMALRDEESIYGGVANAAARIGARTELTNFQLSPTAHFARYSEDPSLNANDQSLTASLIRQGEKISWETDLQGVRDTTLTSELGTTGLTQSNRRHEMLLASFSPQWQATERALYGATVYWMDTHYVDAKATGLVDYEYHSASLNSKYAWTERLSVTGKIDYSRLLVPSFHSLRTSESALVGFDYDLGLRWHASLEAGPSRMRSSFEEERGEVYSAKINRKGERLQLRSALSREVAPTGQGLLSIHDSLEFAMTTSLTEHCSFTAYAAAIRTHDTLQAFGFSTPEVKYYNASVGLDWQVAREWYITARMNGGTQTTRNFQGTDLDAHGYRASLGFTWRGDAWLP